MRRCRRAAERREAQWPCFKVLVGYRAATGPCHRFVNDRRRFGTGPLGPRDRSIGITRMILGALSLLVPRGTVEITDDDRGSVEFNGPRALNYVLGRGLKRARAKIFAVLRGFLFLAFGWWMGWSPGALLAALVFLAVLTVLLDVLRYTFAKRPIHYCHSREYRAMVLLETCTQIERGSSRRRLIVPRPQPLWTLVAALFCTLVLLPATWLTLESMEIIVRKTIFEQWFLPLTLIFVSAWRLVTTAQEIFAARATTPGSIDLFLDSDDVLDTYAAIAALSWLTFLADSGAGYVAVLILCGRLAFRLWRWWQLREASTLLAAVVRRTHPHAAGAVPKPHRAEANDWEEDTSAPEHAARR